MKRVLTPMHEALREPQLIERSRKGDAAAFEQLVQAHFPRVFGVLAQLVGAPEDAEDLAQDCFVRAWKSLPHYRGECAFSSWLYRIAVHLATDHRRARALRTRRSASEEAFGEELVVPASEPAPVEQSSQRELARNVVAAVAGLPERLRTALVLRVLRGLDYAEVARAMGVAPATSRLHVLQARKLLWRRLRVDLDPARGADDARRESRGEQGP